MVNAKLTQRNDILFCVRSGMDRTECIARLHALHSGQCLSDSSIRRWFNKFAQGLHEIKDAPCPGRPIQRTPARINQVRTLLQADPCRTVWELAAQTNLSVNTSHRLLRKDLNMKKKCAHWIPHLLSAAQRLCCVTCAQVALNQMSRRGNVDHVICADEAWFYTWDPKNRQQNKVWLAPGQPKPDIVCIEQSTPKVMLVAFFDEFGLVHREFIPNGLGMTGLLYLGMVQRMVHAVRRRRPQIFRAGHWGLLHDNAPARRSRAVVDFLHARNITIVHHPGFESTRLLALWILEEEGARRMPS